jgi:hypothetical protein
MIRSIRLGRVVAAVVMASAPAFVSHGLSLKIVQQIDTSALNIAAGFPSSIAANGNNLYIGSLFAGGKIVQIGTPLTSPTRIGELVPGGSTPGNGYVTLNTNGTTLVAATNNAGGNDIVQSFNVSTGALNYTRSATQLGIARIDAAAVDPITGEVLVLGFNSSTQTILDPVTAAVSTLDPTPSVLQAAAPTSTGWRDIAFNRTTGDIFLRATGGVARGNRNPASGTTADYTTPDPFEGPAGVQQIATLEDNFQSAINIEYLPTSFLGQSLIVVNDRTPNAGTRTLSQHLVFFDSESGGENGPAAGTTASVSLFAADGVTPFTGLTSGSGIFDFSFDPVNEVLWVADHANALIYAFDTLGGGPTPQAGDFSGDGRVDGADLSLLLANWGATVPPVPAGWTGSQPTASGVDADELSALLANWGFGTSTAIPEPGSVVLLMSACGLFVGRRR